MVMQEERITRLETAQEFNAQQFAEVLSRLNLIITIVEASRQEAREANEAARREARESNETARKEAREMVEAARRDARILFATAITVGISLGAGGIAMVIRLTERLAG